MENVIRYEERDPDLHKQLKIAYPRFVAHHRVLEWEQFLQTKFDLPDKQVHCICSTQAAKDLQRHVGFSHVNVFADEAFAVVGVDKDEDVEFKARKFLQHTGCRISSRQAEDLLLGAGVITGSDVGSPNPDAYESVLHKLTEKIGVRTNEDVFLTNSGMSAVYAAFRAIQDVQAKKDRTLWIQLGWMYVDTYEILNKFAGDDDNKIFIHDPTDLDELAAILADRGDKVAGIISEMPTNPLVQTPDVERLLELSRKHGVALIVDPTVSSIVNVDALPFTDVLVTSLTKYISHEGDVLMGALALQSESPFYDELKGLIAEHVEPPYHRDVQRVADQLNNIETIAETVNGNTMKLAEFFQGHSGVRNLYWSYGEAQIDAYKKIEKDADSPGCMITIDLKKPVTEFYDPCRISKGPSFGMDLTLMSPYMYMAHYDMVSEKSGREELLSYGLNADLIRISVGTEPIEQIIQAFEEVL
ncbi:MAG: PLP-dependent transferase [Verrucomicrobia bacterium]|nr:PLP-dependent transferase [Verrucomicrobiota bacterium]